MVVCRPPLLNDWQWLAATPGGGDAPSDALPELDILPPSEVPAEGSRDADLLRDISVARGGAKDATTLRLPLYGHRGGAPGEQLCEREVAPLLRRLLAGESCAVIAYGQTGSGKSYTMGTEKYAEGEGAPPHWVGAFCASSVFELAREEGVRGLEVSFAAIEVRLGVQLPEVLHAAGPARRRACRRRQPCIALHVVPCRRGCNVDPPRGQGQGAGV